MTIGKRAEGRVTAASIPDQVRSLAAYIDRAGVDDDRGDILFVGACGFVSTKREAQIEEMAATAAGAVKARSPIEHLILSWQPGEQPDQREVRQAVAYLLDEAGLRGHQAIWTLHDARNLHLHVIINRVAPDATTPTKVAFWHNAIGRAVARIEHAQGWRRESGARFQVMGDQYVRQVATNRQTTTGYDRYSGNGSHGGPQGHRTDSKVTHGGLRRNRPPSSDHRRDGDYEPQTRRDLVAAAAGSIAARRARFIAEARLRSAYMNLPKGAASKVADGGLWRTLTPRGDHRYDEAHEQQTRRVLVAAAADTIDARRARLIAEARLRSAYMALPKGAVIVEDVERRDTLSTKAANVETRQGQMSAERIAIEVAGPIIDTAKSWADLHARLAAEGISYKLKGSGAVMLIGEEAVKASSYRKAAIKTLTKRFGAFEPSNTPLVSRPDEPAPGVTVSLFEAIQEKRAKIDIINKRAAESTRAISFAPALAKAVGGAISTNIDIAKLADEIGVERPVLAPIRRPPPPPHDPNSALGRYHRVVQADAYQLKFHKAEPGNGPKKIFMVPAGNIDEVAVHGDLIETMQIEQAWISIQPITRNKHHIVIDGISRAAYEQMLTDGFSPELVLEIDAGKLQVLLGAPSDGSAAARQAASNTVAELRRRYGADPSLNRATEHMLPGTKTPGSGGSRKSDWVVRVISEFPARTCALVRELIEKEIGRVRKQLDNMRLYDLAILRRFAQASKGIGFSYLAHFRDIMRNDFQYRSQSEVDSQIALRLLATGHSKERIKTFVHSFLPALDLARQHDWRHYATTIVDHARSTLSSVTSTAIASTVPIWRKMETETALAILNLLRARNSNNAYERNSETYSSLDLGEFLQGQTRRVLDDEEDHRKQPSSPQPAPVVNPAVRVSPKARAIRNRVLAKNRGKGR